MDSPSLPPASARPPGRLPGRAADRCLPAPSSLLPGPPAAAAPAVPAAAPIRPLGGAACPATPWSCPAAVTPTVWVTACAVPPPFPLA